jgi:peptidoglycan hydrolase-like protein with peptidoglycan-binding domain
MMRGHGGQSVRDLQRELNRQGANLALDGKFGPRTEEALREFQRRRGIAADGRVGTQTLGQMPQMIDPRPAGDTVERAGPSAPPRAPSVGQPPPAGSAPAGPMIRADEDRRNTHRTTTEPAAQPGNPANRTATFDRVVRGGRSQMVEGRITINGNTYRFRSGGGGDGNLPRGDYTVTPHLWNRSDPSMSVGGVGWSFALSDKYDPRVGRTRSLLRIHPDGGGAGTIGCIGIAGDANTQRRFREDMRAELARMGGRFTLQIR